MKKYIIFLSITLLINTREVFPNSDNQSTIKSHMNILHTFKSMYENKFFKKELFDEMGYLQTSLSNEDKMPLNFFVEYNNMWWFSIIDKVIISSIAYDYENNTGFIALDIYYDKTYVLRATQLVKFKDNKINYLRTYASPTFFSQNDIMIKLDSYGNQIWLATGYDLYYSANAALLFFKSPVGKNYASNPKTKAAVEKIKKNLNQFLQLK